MMLWVRVIATKTYVQLRLSYSKLVTANRIISSGYLLAQRCFGVVSVAQAVAEQVETQH